MYGCDRHFAGVARNPRNRFDDVEIFALSPNCEVPVERRISRLGYEEVGVVRVGSAIGHRQASRGIEFERRHDFVLVGKAWSLGMSHAGAEQVAALNQDAWNHTVKRKHVKEFFAHHLLWL